MKIGDNKRANVRRQLNRDCFLSTKEFELINCKAVDISKWGLGVMVNDKTIHLKKGARMFPYIEDMQHFPRAEVKWTKKDNNGTRLGLQLSTNIID